MNNFLIFFLEHVYSIKRHMLAIKGNMK